VSKFEATKAIVIHSIKDLPRQYKELFCPGKGEEDRPTISGFRAFVLCFLRACKQIYTSFSAFFLGVILLYCAVGFLMGSLLNSGDAPPNTLGGYPFPACYQSYPELRGSCLDMQANWMGSIMVVIFFLLSISGAMAASTFGCETSQYWRECSVGLNSPAYYCAKVAADLPLIFVATIAVWAPLTSTFITPMPIGEMFVGLLIMNWFGFLSGYFISFLLPYRYCGLVAVAWAVWWCILFGGVAVSLHTMSNAKFMFWISAPYWFSVGFFYSSTYWPYKRVRSGKSKNKPYFVGVTRYRSTQGLLLNFSSSMGYAFLICFCLFIINLWLITVTKVNKKK